MLRWPHFVSMHFYMQPTHNHTQSINVQAERETDVDFLFDAVTITIHDGARITQLARIIFIFKRCFGWPVLLLFACTFLVCLLLDEHRVWLSDVIRRGPWLVIAMPLPATYTTLFVHAIVTSSSARERARIYKHTPRAQTHTHTHRQKKKKNYHGRKNTKKGTKHR